MYKQQRSDTILFVVMWLSFKNFPRGGGVHHKYFMSETSLSADSFTELNYCTKKLSEYLKIKHEHLFAFDNQLQCSLKKSKKKVGRLVRFS